ncbi:MAG: sodium:calcium antiporter, partial [Methanopyri archaeon]|nr:sodium:calcium antiporter [Methanopyri archaeon]
MALPLTLPVILLFIEFVVAIILVYFGSEWVVDSASAMALYLGVSSAFIGLTLISVGTSIPEIAVSTTAAFKGYGGVSGGNIIGSDLVQITLILGICAF